MRAIHFIAMGAVLGSLATTQTVRAADADKPIVTEPSDKDGRSNIPSSRPSAGDAPIGTHRDDIVPPEGGFKPPSRGMEARPDPGDVDVNR